MRRNAIAAGETADKEKPDKKGPKFEVGSIAITTKDSNHPFGMVKAHTDVELFERYMHGVIPYWKVQSLGCKSCSLIVEFSIAEGSLVDYEERKPAVAP